MELYVDYVLGAWYVMDADTPGAIEAGPFKTEAEAWNYVQKTDGERK